MDTDPRRLTCVINTWNYTPTSPRANVNKCRLKELSHPTGQPFDRPANHSSEWYSWCGVPSVRWQWTKKAYRLRCAKTQNRHCGLLRNLWNRATSNFFSSPTLSHPYYASRWVWCVCWQWTGGKKLNGHIIDCMAFAWRGCD